MSYNVPPSGYRPFVGDNLPIVYVRATGSDELGNGSLSFPFLTVAKAIASLPISPTDSTPSCTIDIGAGTFDVPAVLTLANNITLRGTQALEDIGTVDAVNAASNDANLDLDVSGLTGGIADTLRARLILFADGPAVGRYGWIYRSGATSLGVTRIFSTESTPTSNLDLSLVAPVVGNTFNLIELQTTLRWVGNASLTQSTQLNIQDCIVTSATTGQSIFAVGTDKVEFIRCLVQGQRRIQAGAAGAVFLQNCYIYSAGFFDAGMLACVRGGRLYLYSGTVVDGGNAGSNNHILVGQGATLELRNQIVFRDLDTPIRTDGGNITVPGSRGTEDTLLLENLSGVASNNGYLLEVNNPGGLGGNIVLPFCNGETLGTYVVTAQRITTPIDYAGSVTTSLGVNTVSTDNGSFTRAISGSGTVIFGGNPLRTMGYGAYEPVRINGPAAPYDVQPWEQTTIDPTAGAVTWTLPESPELGDSCAVINGTAITANAITVDGNGNTIASVSAPGTFVASESFSIAGLAITYTYDGSNWVIR
jgi:hypothetical protein